jgi:hypothetical protein
VLSIRELTAPTRVEIRVNFEQTVALKEIMDCSEIVAILNKIKGDAKFEILGILVDLIVSMDKESGVAITEKMARFFDQVSQRIKGVKFYPFEANLYFQKNYREIFDIVQKIRGQNFTPTIEVLKKSFEKLCKKHDLPYKKIRLGGNFLPLLHYIYLIYNIYHINIIYIIIKYKKHCPQKICGQCVSNKKLPTGMVRTKPATKPTQEKQTKPSKSKLNARPKVESKTPPKDKNKPYKSLATRLAKIVKSHRNVHIQQSQINSWANEIRKLCKGSKIKRSRVKHALDWYANKIGGKYIPVILSGSALRNKFPNLESAMERDANKQKSIVGLGEQTLEEKYGDVQYMMKDGVLYDKYGNEVK